MDVVKLRDAVIELIKYAEKEAYFNNNDLFLEINSPYSRFSVCTNKDSTISITVYFSDAIYYRFLIDKSGILLTERGSVPDLIERYGINYLLNLLNNAAHKLLMIGKKAIDSDNYIFRDTSSDTDKEDYRWIDNSKTLENKH